MAVFDSWWGQGIFLFATMSRLAQGLTLPPTKWVLGALFLGGWGLVTYRICLHGMVLKLSIRTTLPLPDFKVPVIVLFLHNLCS
jgi:hypothetical protein